ncbi:class I SAM-dependent methyltransferase [Gammaproteobacteria bacterium]|nr:class I SAM-dependent methyltransferase [Gammaproteobacteria bacterium]MDC3106059.1 class I SAM-dependent methyltransferase [Gammaproteobacteria bacterium]
MIMRIFRRIVIVFIHWKIKYFNHSNGVLFDLIYRYKLWGDNGRHHLFSGTGSHAPECVKTHSDIFNLILEQFTDITSVLDVGCGDCNVSVHLFDSIKNYVGVDVSDLVIQQNKSRFPYKTFLTLDATKDTLPKTHLIVLRQVLQHLSNEDISLLVSNCMRSSKYLLVTDAVPSKLTATNVDIFTGPNTRARLGSSINLVQHPFNFRFERVIDGGFCRHAGDIIETKFFVLNKKKEVN